MINEKSILEWRKFAPWIEPAYIEQDLVISRALVEIYNHPYLKNKLVFRGGTALSKIFVTIHHNFSDLEERGPSRQKISQRKKF